MNRLVLVPCIVVACYVAAAPYFASYIVYLLDRARDGFPIPTFASNRGEILKESSSQQPSSVHLSYEIPNKPVGENPATIMLPERPRQEAMLVTVLLPARVHTGPSVDTPINHFYAVGTPLHATRYQNDWFEISEPGTSKSGWIYRKYLGAISNSEQSKMVLQERKDKSLLPRCPLRLSVTRRPPQRSVTRRPFQPSVMRAPSGFRENQARQHRNPTAAVPKWQVCCSAHSAATEEWLNKIGPKPMPKGDVK